MKNLLTNTVLIFTDSLSLYLALYLAHITRIFYSEHDYFGIYTNTLEDFFLSGYIFALFIAVNFSLGLYTKRNDFWEELRRSYLGAFLLLIGVTLLLFITKSTQEFSRATYILMFFNLLWLTPLLRVLIKRLLLSLGLWRIDALFDGNQEQLQRLKKMLQENWYLGYRETEDIKKAKVVFIATKDIPIDKLEQMIHRYKHRIKEVIIIPFLHNISFANADIVDLRIGRMSFINIQNQLFIKKNIFIKKCAEFSLLIVLTPIVTPIFLLIALLIKLDSKGSVFFKQQRLGKEGKVFSCYKFRTMYENNDILLQNYLERNPQEVANYAKYHKYKNDPRITRFGSFLRRYSLDELPQIINVFRFEMNLIGPRPYMVNERVKIGEDIDTILHVRPGLTGLWQISGRNDLTFYERIELDKWYIQNWSLWLDFIIFLKTFVVLVTKRGAA